MINKLLIQSIYFKKQIQFSMETNIEKILLFVPCSKDYQTINNFQALDQMNKFFDAFYLKYPLANNIEKPILKKFYQNAFDSLTIEITLKTLSQEFLNQENIFIEFFQIILHDKIISIEKNHQIYQIFLSVIYFFQIIKIESLESITILINILNFLQQKIKFNYSLIKNNLQNSNINQISILEFLQKKLLEVISDFLPVLNTELQIKLQEEKIQ